MLQTNRLHLRNLRPSDLNVLFAYRNDIRCSLYQRYEDTTVEYLQKYICTYSNSTFLSTEEEQHYAIACHPGGEMIGDLSLFFSENDNCFTVGITIAPQFQHQGYAYELLREVIAQIQRQYPCVDIVALIEKENTKSISLFKKIGFTEECYADSIRSYIFTIPGKTQ